MRLQCKIMDGPTPDSLGSMLEITQGGKNPVALPSGETRAFVEDGDEVILRTGEGLVRAPVPTPSNGTLIRKSLKIPP